MDVVHPRCAGIDVHKKVVVVCARVKARRLSRSFGATTGELRELRDWLVSLAVTHAAMESTGSYWKPVFNLLEASGVEAIVVNAAHVKAVPSRKTDVNDAQWLAELLRYGLLQPSFISDREQRELREVVRYRRSVLQDRLAPRDLLQRRLATLLKKLLEAVETVPAVPHHPARLRDVAKLLGQLQQPSLDPNDLLLLRHRRSLVPSPLAGLLTQETLRLSA